MKARGTRLTGKALNGVHNENARRVTFDTVVRVSVDGGAYRPLTIHEALEHIAAGAKVTPDAHSHKLFARFAMSQKIASQPRA